MGRVVVDEVVEIDVVVWGNVLVVVVATSVVLVGNEVDDVVVVEDVVVEDVVEVVCKTPLVVNAESGTIAQPSSSIFQASIRQDAPPFSYINN
jgi:hypothetical protein